MAHFWIILPAWHKGTGPTASQAFNTKQTGYILVDQNGKRFINEKQIEHHAGILAVNYFDSYEMKYPRIPCYAIFDANSKEDGAFAPSYGSGWLRHREKWNWSRSNDKEIEAGIVKVGQNIQELAEKIGVDAKNLQATIGQWNSDLKDRRKKTLCLDVRLKVTSAKYGRTAQARNNLLLRQTALLRD